jgi:peptide methionine sulfoxide reductase msrA/msrB
MFYTVHMKTAQALFAAGCFWGVQYYFDEVPGVTKTTAVYAGGHTDNPTYDQVVTHLTGYAEAVLVVFDPAKVSYETLVKHFFRLHDPTQLNRQGPDIGDTYRSAIFYFDDEQKRIAEEVRDDIQEDMNGTIVTEITKADRYYEAESYHQKFTERTGIGMCHIPYEPIK